MFKPVIEQVIARYQPTAVVLQVSASPRCRARHMRGGCWWAFHDDMVFAMGA
jgi:hypothetical protein